MSERLLSVGLDVGTTSTQVVVSELTVENRASSFAVPELEIARRNVRYKGKVHFTPLLNDSLVDGKGVREILEAEYRNAGISREDVDTGAIIITGETSRKENARAVLAALSDHAGDFVVATAGPDLESILAAKGAGAVDYSRETGKTLLHMDIGGGTSNLALIRDGEILQTGCLNVGGRLIKLGQEGEITYLSPVLRDLVSCRVGDILTLEQAEKTSALLTSALEMAAGLREADDLLEALLTKETGRIWEPPGEPVLISFSGGVADCIETNHPPFAFGDIGPILGSAIRKSPLCRGEYILGSETIRATVIGAGCYSAQLSGSTVFCRNVKLPLKNIPVVSVRDLSRLADTKHGHEEVVMFALPGKEAPSYQEVTEMAEQLAAVSEQPLLICLEQDMAKALGQALALRLPPEHSVLCIDRVRVGENSYLDVGSPVGCAFPVVVKTLVLAK